MGAGRARSGVDGVAAAVPWRTVLFPVTGRRPDPGRWPGGRRQGRACEGISSRGTTPSPGPAACRHGSRWTWHGRMTLPGRRCMVAAAAVPLAWRIRIPPGADRRGLSTLRNVAVGAGCAGAVPPAHREHPHRRKPLGHARPDRSPSRWPTCAAGMRWRDPSLPAHTMPLRHGPCPWHHPMRRLPPWPPTARPGKNAAKGLDKIHPMGILFPTSFAGCTSGSPPDMMSDCPLRRTASP
jgi:hypothetical protein